MNLDIEKIKSENIPIHIVSSLRVGSTWLAQYIANTLDYTYFHEPSRFEPEQQQNFYLFANKSKKYVLKEHAFLFVQNYPESFILNPSFSIRLRRRNLFKQVLSYYVAFVREKYIYHYAIRDVYFGETIKLDSDILLKNFEEVKNHNDCLDSYKYKIDLDLYYEDLNLPQGEVSVVDYRDYVIPTVKPLNNDELTEWAYNILKDKL